MLWQKQSVRVLFPRASGYKRSPAWHLILSVSLSTLSQDKFAKVLGGLGWRKERKKFSIFSFLPSYRKPVRKWIQISISNKLNNLPLTYFGWLYFNYLALFCTPSKPKGWSLWDRCSAGFSQPSLPQVHLSFLLSSCLTEVSHIWKLN